MTAPRAFATGQYTILAQCREGMLMFNRNDTHVGQSLRAYGDYSMRECQLFDALVKPDMVVVEAGAHIGALTVVLAKRAAKVYAFEPQRLPFQMLCANLTLCECRNVWAFNAAVGNENGTTTVTDIDPTTKHNSGGVILPSADGESVGMVKLDHAFVHERAPLGVSWKFDFLKADVEGMELAVLRGARRSIEQYRPLLYLEALYNYAAIEAFLLERDYDIYWHVSPMFDPDNFCGEKKNIFNGSSSISILCVPNESTALQAAGITYKENTEIIVDEKVITTGARLIK